MYILALYRADEDLFPLDITCDSPLKPLFTPAISVVTIIAGATPVDATSSTCTWRLCSRRMNCVCSRLSYETASEAPENHLSKPLRLSRDL